MSFEHLDNRELAELVDSLMTVEDLLSDYSGSWRIGLERIRADAEQEQARRAGQQQLPGMYDHWLGEIPY